MPHKKHHQRKRRRAQSSCNDTEEAASYIRPPEFWEALSEIALSHQSLKEFARRTTPRKSRPVVPAVTRLLRSDAERLICFAKDGGPNLNHLRGYANLPSTSVSESSLHKRKARTTSPYDSCFTTMPLTGPYDARFEQLLVDNGIYPDCHRDPKGKTHHPDNLGDIQERIAQRRPSLSPSHFHENFIKEFQTFNRHAPTEAIAMSMVVPAIAGFKDLNCDIGGNNRFNNLKKFAKCFKMAQPDRFYGASPNQIDPLVRHDLDQYIVPCNNTSLPAASNFFLEGKSAEGRADIARRQVIFDIAHGARAMFQLQNYGKKTPVYDGNAYSLGSFYHQSTGSLQIFAAHPKQSANGTEYHVTLISAYTMISDIEAFCRGAAAYRNARDFAKEQRDRFIDDANAIARSASTVQQG